MAKKANNYTTVAHLYDYDASPRMNKDIPFYLEYADALGGGVLDLCCGTGRVAIPLAKAGHNVTAIDASEAMLSVFKGKLSSLGAESKQIKIIEADATNFEIKQRFNLAIIPYRSFQQFAHRVDANNCLSKVYNHLNDGGVFIISCYRPLGTLDENWVYPKTKQWEIVSGGKRIIKYHWGEKINVEHSLIYPVLCYEVIDGNNKEVLYEDLTLKFYYQQELEDMITAAGFTITDRFGDYDKTDIGSGTEMIFVCKKQSKAS